MNRFVILRHEMPADAERPSHWDLMLEGREALSTWALEQLPQSGQDVPADQLPDHRKAYLDYEGPVSGGRGTVHRWDWGQYERHPAAGQQWCVQLRGQRLCGTLRLTPCEPHPGQQSVGEPTDCRTRQRWKCGFTPDDDMAAC